MIYIRLMVFFLLIHTISYGQEKNNGYFFIPKFGLYGASGWQGTAFSIEGGVLKNNTSFGIAYSQTFEIFGTDGSRAFDMTIGRFTNESSSFYFHAQTGISAIWINKWSIEAEETASLFTVGLPLKAGGKFIPLHFPSIGIDLQANVNARQSMYMIVLTLGVWHINE